MTLRFFYVRISFADRISQRKVFLMKKKNTFLKVMAVFLLIQGVLQLLSMAMVVGHRDEMKVPESQFYITVSLTVFYGLIAVGGGMIAMKYRDVYSGCKRAFYFGLALLVITVVMLVMNCIAGAFNVSQIGSFLIPGLFTAAAFLGAQSLT